MGHSPGLAKLKVKKPLSGERLNVGNTLAQILAKDRINFATLHRRYRPLLQLVKVLIGVVPNCDRYLEIWQPGFRTYNLLIPTFLNLPGSLLNRGVRKDLVGLSVYASSRAAGCAYCTAHTCSYALRRGTPYFAINGNARSPAEIAATQFAEALSTMPHHYTGAQRVALSQHFTTAQIEWIALGVGLMGFLNKFMDGLGVELEPECVVDVGGLLTPTGWSIGQHGWATPPFSTGGFRSGFLTKDSPLILGTVARHAPGAIRLERDWLQHTPRDRELARRGLKLRHGWDEPLITAIHYRRPSRALAATLAHNLDAAHSTLGLKDKMLAGVVYATYANNPSLHNRCMALAVAHGASAQDVAAATGRATYASDQRLDAVLALAAELAPSPAGIQRLTLEVVANKLQAQEIVELVVWVALCQLLHRLHLFFELIPLTSEPALVS
jgi:hypothetical protein